jgi:hypothetical protein
MPRLRLNVCAAICVGAGVEHRQKALHVASAAAAPGGGGVGDEGAAVEQGDAEQHVGEGAGGLGDRPVDAAVGEDRARGVAGGHGDEATAGEVEAGVGERRQVDLADHRVAAGVDDVDHAFAGVVEHALADHRLAGGAGR